VDKVILKNERGHGIGFFAATFVAEIVLGLLASIIVMWFSRRREYRADAGGAALAGRENMIAALQRLKATYEQPTAMPDGMKAFGISSGGGMLGGLLRTHPSLDDRIEALRAAGTANPGLVR
jgi:heat shock protein HtpX